MPPVSKLAEQLSSRKEKPSRRYSLPAGVMLGHDNAIISLCVSGGVLGYMMCILMIINSLIFPAWMCVGHPAIRLVDSGKARKGYRVREKGKSPVHTEASSADCPSDISNGGSRGGGGGGPHVVPAGGGGGRVSISRHSGGGGGAVTGASHHLPIPHVSPSLSGNSLSDQSATSTQQVEPNNTETGGLIRCRSPATAFRRKVDDDVPPPEMTHSPLNIPSTRSRPPTSPPTPVALPLRHDCSSDDSSDGSEISLGMDARDTPPRKTPLMTVWNMTETLPSPNEEARLRTVSDSSDINPPPKDVPISTVQCDMSQMFSGAAVGTLAEYQPQAEDASSDIGDYLLPPPATSPSFPPALTCRQSPASSTERRSSEPSQSPFDAADVQNLYHNIALHGMNDSETDPASPPSSQNPLPVVPVMAADIPIQSSKKRYSARFSMSHDAAPEPTVAREERGTQVGGKDMVPMGDLGGKAYGREKGRTVESRVLQAAKETAESYRLASTSGTKLRELFKACQQVCF